jgi:hypothetical protein
MQNRSRTGFNFEPPGSPTMVLVLGYISRKSIYIFWINMAWSKARTKDAEPGSSGGCSASKSTSIPVLPTVLVLSEPSLNQSLNRSRTGHSDPP